ncbi:hypothetical protein [Microbacterium sp. LMI1-1-1.1]|uniref:DUF7882 family protein n=1 Tax=Microbacterium sp. LMI1-1-1.1 TaxID=3135223 RepID=UPI003467D7BB
MGQLFYGTANTSLPIHDRLLAYLQVVIATKMRRGESFTLSWTSAPGAPEARTTIWLQPAIQIRFVYDGTQPERLHPAYLHNLAAQANSSGGIIVGAATWEDQEKAHGKVATR